MSRVKSYFEPAIRQWASNRTGLSSPPPSTNLRHWTHWAKRPQFPSTSHPPTSTSHDTSTQTARHLHAHALAAVFFADSESSFPLGSGLDALVLDIFIPPLIQSSPRQFLDHTDLSNPTTRLPCYSYFPQESCDPAHTTTSRHPIVIRPRPRDPLFTTIL